MTTFSYLQQFNINGAQVYVAQFENSVQVQAVLPAIRQQSIEQCADDLHKRQRYCVWRLLDYALQQRIGKGVDELSFSVDGNGKWSCNGGVHFSLSHCGNVVAVAVSEHPVGIDVEACDVERFNARLAQRILTDGERETYQALPTDKRPQALLEIWTKKESLFKRDGGKTFTPNAIDTSTNNSQCQTLEIHNNKYVVAVAIN